MINTFNGKYKITRLIGQGGMAGVYLAQDNKFDTNVAIKILNKEFVFNENIRKRFLAEAKSMFKMSHPNIIKVTDLIEEGDTVAFVMEYIEGETLKDYLERKGKLSNEEIKGLFTQILNAVAYVHEQQLVHRDIKPSNLMVDKKGKVKLMDFGIAKNSDTNSAEYTQTSTSQQMGTPMYMSPEQVNETKSVTAQSDIYSLGVVLWQMVMGQKPYDTKTFSTFQLQSKIVNEKLALTHTIWDNCIQKACAKNREERYLNCNAWLAEISQTTSSNSTSETKYDKTEIANNTNINIDATQIQTNNDIKIDGQKLKFRNPGDAKEKSNNLFKIITVISMIDVLISIFFQFFWIDSITPLLLFIFNITLFVSLIFLLKLKRIGLTIYLISTSLIVLTSISYFNQANLFCVDDLYGRMCFDTNYRGFISYQIFRFFDMNQLLALPLILKSTLVILYKFIFSIFFIRYKILLNK
jgi:serine/threonine protein kinase